MKRACFQLIFWVANYRECPSKVKRLMATFATRGVECHGNALLFAMRLYFADKFVPSHNSIIGRKRPFMQQVSCG